MPNNHFHMDDKEILYTALSNYANWIETKDPLMSRNDIIAAGDGARIKKLPNLSDYQLDFIKHIRELAQCQR